MEFAERVAKIARIAGGQRALARIVGVSPGTVAGWLGTAKPYPNTLRDISAKTGIPIEWLQHGSGDEKAILLAFENRLRDSTENFEQSRLTDGEIGQTTLREHPPENMEYLMMTAPPSRGLEGVIEKMAARQNSAEIVETMSEISRDRSMTEEDRNAITSRLTLILAKKLATERAGRTKKN